MIRIAITAAYDAIASTHEQAAPPELTKVGGPHAPLPCFTG
jgi:hypothetical protein